MRSQMPRPSLYRIRGVWRDDERRIGENEIELPAGDRGEQIAVHAGDVVEAVQRGVERGERHGARVEVGGGHLPAEFRGDAGPAGPDRSRGRAPSPPGDESRGPRSGASPARDLARTPPPPIEMRLAAVVRDQAPAYRCHGDGRATLGIARQQARLPKRLRRVTAQQVVDLLPRRGHPEQGTDAPATPARYGRRACGRTRSALAAGARREVRSEAVIEAGLGVTGLVKHGADQLAGGGPCEARRRVHRQSIGIGSAEDGAGARAGLPWRRVDGPPAARQVA